MRIVTFYVMRHGKKDGDKLTEVGIAQVRKSALTHLADIKFDAALHSEMNRAKQTVDEALDAIDQQDITRETDFGFGYTWYIGDQECTYEPAKFRRFDKMPDNDKDLLTVGEIMKAWPPARAFGPRVKGTLLSQSFLMAQRFPDPENINVLVGSHSPCGEMAAPFDFPRLKEADIVRYDVEFMDNGEPRIVDFQYLGCPTVAQV